MEKVEGDWFEQAVKAGKNYLEYGSFSRDDLITQLEFVGFATEEAVYAVEEIGL